MIGKFSILKSLDLEKINKNIYIYECETGNEPYLFMSNETVDAIYKEVTSHLDSLPKKVMSDIFTLYEGYKVFLNNDLEFGEVEIR